MTRRRYRSLDAYDWACEQRSGHAAANHLLIVMARLVSDKSMTTEGGKEWPPLHCWASKDTLAEATEQDPKTVDNGLKRLISAGLIERVGVEGATGRIHVYRLRINDTKNGVIEQQVMTPVFPSNHPKFGQSPIKELKKGKKRRESTPSAFASQSKTNSREQTPFGETFAEWCDRLKTQGERRIPDNDPIRQHAVDIAGQRSADLLDVQWHVFRQRHTDGVPDKRHTNWRGYFRMSLHGNWFEVFEIKNGLFQWTNLGLQAIKSLNAEIDREEALLQAAKAWRSAQRNGRGRFSRRLAPPAGSAVAVTLLLRTRHRTLDASALSRLAAGQHHA
jgi:hypothetical protein